MPKLIQQKKENNSKLNQKKAKPSKTKQKKIIPAKKPKSKEKTKLPKSKKALVLLVSALMIIIICAAAAIILLTMHKKDASKEKAPVAPAYYFSKEEGISSVTEVVGQRDFEKLAVPAANQPETKVSGDAESQEDKDSQTHTAKESAAGSESQEEIYKYLHVDDVSADLKSYRSYLEGEKSFIDVTDKNQQTADSSVQESKEENAEIYQFAGPSTDSGAYLSITLESKEGSYTVTACKEKQSWTTYFKDLWTQQKKKIEDFEKTPKATNTIEQAEDTVLAQGQEKLGLPETADSYIYIAAPGISNIDEKDYYTVRTYKRQSDDTLIYVATYLFDYNTSSVAFEYNEVTRETTPLS